MKLTHRARAFAAPAAVGAEAGQGTVKAKRRGRPSRRRAGRVAAGVVFALTPWVTLGFGTPVAFIVAAVVFRSWRRAYATALWISAAFYTADFVACAAVSAGKPSVLFYTCWLILFVGGGVQALFTVWFAGTGRPSPATAITLRPARLRDARPSRAAVVIAIEYHVTISGQPGGSAPVTFVWEGADHPPPIGTRLRVYDLAAPDCDAISAST